MRITKKQLRDELESVSKAVKWYTALDDAELKAEYLKVFPSSPEFMTIVPPSRGDLLNSLLQANLHYVRLVFKLD